MKTKYRYGSLPRTRPSKYQPGVGVEGGVRYPSFNPSDASPHSGGGRQEVRKPELEPSSGQGS